MKDKKLEKILALKLVHNKKNNQLTAIFSRKELGLKKNEKPKRAMLKLMGLK